MAHAIDILELVRAFLAFTIYLVSFGLVLVSYWIRKQRSKLFTLLMSMAYLLVLSATVLATYEQLGILFASGIVLWIVVSRAISLVFLTLAVAVHWKLLNKSLFFFVLAGGAFNSFAAYWVNNHPESIVYVSDIVLTYFTLFAVFLLIVNLIMKIGGGGKNA